MGNSQTKRNSEAPPSRLEQARTFCAEQMSNVEQLIFRGKLAPTETAEGGDNGIECPICFVAYLEVNSMRCCNQSLCTECYKSMKSSGTNPRCPYCDCGFLSVFYYEKKGEPSNSEVVSHDHDPTRMPPKTPPQPVNTCPVMKLSTADRAELEREISMQHFLEADSNTELRRVPGSPSRSNSNTSSPRRRQSNITSHRSPTQSPRRTTYAARARQQYIREQATAQGINEALDANDLLLLSQLGDVNLIEEILLAEAIRQSLLVSQPDESSAVIASTDIAAVHEEIPPNIEEASSAVHPDSNLSAVSKEDPILSSAELDGVSNDEAVDVSDGSRSSVSSNGVLKDHLYLPSDSDVSDDEYIRPISLSPCEEG